MSTLTLPPCPPTPLTSTDLILVRDEERRRIRVLRASLRRELAKAQRRKAKRDADRRPVFPRAGFRVGSWLRYSDDEMKDGMTMRVTTLTSSLTARDTNVVGMAIPVSRRSSELPRPAVDELFEREEVLYASEPRASEFGHYPTSQYAEFERDEDDETEWRMNAVFIAGNFRRTREDLTRYNPRLDVEPATE